MESGEGLPILRLMKNIGVVVNTKRSRTEGVLAELRSLAEGHGFNLYAEDAEIAGLLGAEHLPIGLFAEKEVDVALAMGGDGTVLYTACALHGCDIPIMGINLGSLGFLTSVGDTEIFQACGRVPYFPERQSGWRRARA